MNPFATERHESNFQTTFFKLNLQIDILSTSCEIGLRWLPQNLIDAKWTLVQVIAWCHLATSHYLRQCWSRSASPYGVTRPQCMKSINDLRRKKNEKDTYEWIFIIHIGMCDVHLVSPLMTSCYPRTKYADGEKCFPHVIICCLNSVISTQ